MSVKAGGSRVGELTARCETDRWVYITEKAAPR